jgi:hypothetical protein
MLFFAKTYPIFKNAFKKSRTAKSTLSLVPRVKTITGHDRRSNSTNLRVISSFFTQSLQNSSNFLKNFPKFKKNPQIPSNSPKISTKLTKIQRVPKNPTTTKLKKPKKFYHYKISVSKITFFAKQKQTIFAH